MLRHRREHQHWLLGRLLGLGLPLCAYLTQQNGPRVSENGVVTLGVTCQVLHKISCCHTELTLSRTLGWRNLQLAAQVRWPLEKNLHTGLGSSLSFFKASFSSEISPSSSTFSFLLRLRCCEMTFVKCCPHPWPLACPPPPPVPPQAPTSSLCCPLSSARGQACHCAPRGSGFPPGPRPSLHRSRAPGL